SNATSPVPPAAIAALPGVRAVTPLQATTTDVALTPPGASLGSVSIAGSQRAIAGHGAPVLGPRDAAYRSDAAVYDAVRTNPNLIIIDHDFLHDNPAVGGPVLPGARVALRSPVTGVTRTFRVAAVQADLPG